MLCVGAPISAEPVEDAQLVEPTKAPKHPGYAQGHVWKGEGLGAAVVALTVDNLNTVFAVSADGAVYRKGEGATWQTVLGATGGRLGDIDELDEEDLLLDMEVLLLDSQDLSQEPEEEEDELADDTEDGEETEDAKADFGSDAMDDSDGALVDELFGLDSKMEDSTQGPKAGRLVWASSEHAGMVFAARGDGLWRSVDGGLTWRRTLRAPAVHSLSDGPNGLIFAGTVQGLRVSKDAGGTWGRIADPIANIETYSFAYDGGLLFAGTVEGLYRSKDGLNWAKLLSRYDADIPVWTVAIDRFWDGGLWVAGPVGILRSDNGGEQLRAAGQNTLAGTTVLLPLAGPGHLLAAGVDGVWESRDGGMRWRPVANGLPSPANTHLAMSDQGPMLGGKDGVFQLKTTAGSFEATALERVEITPGAEMGTLVVVALNRPGMVMGTLLTQGAIARSLLLPKLTVSGDWSESRMLSADFDGRSNRGHVRRSWHLGLSACFGACSTGASYGGYSDAAGSGGEDLAVVGGEVYSASNEGSLAPMAANVAERVTRYRTDVANRITELVIARYRLLESSPSFAVLSLQDQVGHELDVAESIARLDVYTNGYFSRVLEGS
jgi:hypothetical protein